MGVRIRLKRVGRKHKPSYRVTAIDGRRDRSGSVIEELGWFDPLKKDEAQQVRLNRERVEYWLSVGAQPTETMRRILHKQGFEMASTKASAQRAPQGSGTVRM